MLIWRASLGMRTRVSNISFSFGGILSSRWGIKFLQYGSLYVIDDPLLNEVRYAQLVTHGLCLDNNHSIIIFSSIKK